MYYLRISKFSGIDQVFRVIAIIPENSKIYNLIEEDNMEGLKMWLSAREASPFGVSPMGQTLLDVGFYQLLFEMHVRYILPI